MVRKERDLDIIISLLSGLETVVAAHLRSLKVMLYAQEL